MNLNLIQFRAIGKGIIADAYNAVRQINLHKIAVAIKRSPINSGNCIPVKLIGNIDNWVLTDE